MRWLGLCLLLGACSFDNGGVGDDEPTPDAILVTIDADGCDGPDEDGDGAGDACDPQPTEPGNALLFFEGFDDPAALDDWRPFNGGQWDVRDGALHQDDVTGFRTLYLGTQQFDGAHVAARFVIDELGSAADAGFGTLLGFSIGAGSGAGYYCLVYDNLNQTQEPASLHLITLRGAAPYETEQAVVLGGGLAEAAGYGVTSSRREDGSLACAAATGVTSGNDTQFGAGAVAVRTQWMTAHVEYVAVFAMP